ncbi:DUF2330 domain-containing protein [Streptomyces sp. NPDC059165]|uniref:DUF2330 domain-containing protein n=1 Tax=Streptomyces sp. NPDC059165 TaxID=3346751 RepID=UPI0036994583
MRGMKRILLLVCALFAVQLGSLIAPAYACGCGAMIPEAQKRMNVDRETSAVHWDGRTEEVVMRFSVSGDGARSAAWVMPVPGRATVELGDSALFDELEGLTRPERRDRYHFWPRGSDWPFDPSTGDTAAAPPPAAAAPPVGVVGRQRLGRFDVARLTATDPDALSGWLHEHGFTLPPRLAPELKPYVDQKWEYVAVRLAPERADEGLRGTLDPLRIRFASQRLVYPMRLSRLALHSQTLDLYVLAAHRMEPRDRIGGNAPEVTFAGEVEPWGAVGELTGGTPAFLTALEQYFPEPWRIDGDHELRATAEDAPFRRVVYRDRLLVVAGVPVWLITVGAVVAAVVTVLVRQLRARGRRAAVPPPVSAPPPLP